ncbi:VirD4-like conjugal transfer protein, CD1115 family [Lactovum miscens]|uniref:Type IV secretion system protein VirD4 n=1 Tax=Lactovum miscens TaxID=190387 RepID=A0A841C7R2_9LACT|nr:type IV secretory system conjugative DNA transfer family protein [Lactovum miscens]MBB5887591.1 type IV secretion system protein VirD4 [Lactovum miscens]
MQVKKKKMRPYFILAAILFVLSYWLGNFLTNLPGYNIASKETFLISGDVSFYFSQNVIKFFILPNFIALMLALVAGACGFLAYFYNNDHGIYRNDEEHGSARLATEKEIERYADPDFLNNILFTQHSRMGLFKCKAILNDYVKNKNTLVIGGPGSGKTHTFVKPNIMQRNATYVVTESKSLLVHELGKMLEDDGFQLKVFDLVNLWNSNQFNVFKYIYTELDLDRVLSAITESTKKGGQKGEDFWAMAEALLSRALIAYLWFDGKQNNYLPHIGMIGDMLRHIKRDNPKSASPVEEWFEEQNLILPNNYAYRQWSLFNSLFEAETRMSVLAIVAARFSVFDHEQVVNMIREDNMNIETWNEDKTAVFIEIPDTSDDYNFIAAIFVSTITEVLKNKADKIKSGEIKLPEGKKLLHVRFLLDEFANIGKLPNIDKMLAVFRSRDMSIVILLQALDQLKTMYPHGWATLANSCDTVLFLGGDEQETTKWLSQRAGKQTISIKNQSLTKGGRGGSSESRQKQPRDLFTQDEIGRLGGGDALLFIAGENVFRDKKYNVFEHPNGALLASDVSDPKWYQYRYFMTEEEEILSKVKPENLIDHGAISQEVA